MPNNMPNVAGLFAARVNNYCPAMRYSADVNYNGNTRVNFGVLPTANPTAIANAMVLTTAGTTDVSANGQMPAPYGQCVQVVASGANSGNITVRGWDYLGQPISEQLTLNGSTPVTGGKAFKWVSSVQFTSSGTTLNVGTSNKLGLPYKSIRCQYEVADQVVAAAGTLVAPVLTDPQTVSTNDPRGTYVPTTTPNGTASISAVFDCINDTNAANNGGLYGIRHFAS